MANELTVPLLPCASIEDIVEFYRALGFETTYQQRKPYACAGLRREDLHLQFFEMAGFDPAQSYGSCLVLTSDIEGLHRAFADGMRAAYGKVLVSGTPRMTRPRARKNNDGVGGFSVIDPGGNWIRVVHYNPAGDAVPAGDAAAAGRLGKALANAVVQADSRGEAGQAVRILDSALARSAPGDDPVELVEVLVYRAELALVLDDPDTAAAMLDRAGRVELTADESERASGALANAADLKASSA
jgi:hypothetical protein